MMNLYATSILFFQSILIEKQFCNDLLKDFCTALKSKSEHLFKNFMDKEKYFSPSEETVSAAQSCNNIALERLMAQLDRSVNNVPNSNVVTRDSKIMYSNIKTDKN